MASQLQTDVRIVLGNLHTWAHAVQIEGRRILEEGPTTADAFVDSILLALALRNLLRSADLARKVITKYDETWALDLSNEVTVAIRECEDKTPGIKDLRDVLEHFDAYELGLGNLQKKGLDLIFALGFEREDERFVLKVGRHESDRIGTPFSAHFRLDVGLAVEGALALHLPVYNVMMRLSAGGPALPAEED
jgi:hypothetical protein